MTVLSKIIPSSESPTRGAIFLCCLGMVGGTLAQNSSNRFFTAAESVEPRTAITQRGQFSMGFSMDSLLPMSRPYSTAEAGVEGRFQVMSSGALDLAYGLSNKLEVGLSIGYAGFESRFSRDLGGGAKQVENAKFNLFPNTKALVRYYMNISQGIAAAFEGSLGFGIGKTNVVTTTGGIDAIKQNKNSVGAHVGAGISLGWAEDYTAHFLAGFAFQSLGTSTYTTTSYELSQKSSISGVYLKGQIRYQF